MKFWYYKIKNANSVSEKEIVEEYHNIKEEGTSILKEESWTFFTISTSFWWTIPQCYHILVYLVWELVIVCKTDIYKLKLLYDLLAV